MILWAVNEGVIFKTFFKLWFYLLDDSTSKNNNSAINGTLCGKLLCMFKVYVKKVGKIICRVFTGVYELRMGLNGLLAPFFGNSTTGSG